MKKTTRILSLVLCLAMLAGVFAASAFAVEPTVILEEDFSDVSDFTTLRDSYTHVPVTVGEANSQHVKLIHNADSSKRVLLGYALEYDYSDKVFENGVIGAKDLTFECKITDGAKLMIEFYIIWDITNEGGAAQTAARRCTVWVEGNKISDGIEQEQVGTIPASVDLSQWHTYTVRCSRANGISGDYLVDLLIDGVDYTTERHVMGNQGTSSAARDRFAIHARTAGAIEIDNIEIAEMELESSQGAVKNGTYDVVWETDFGAPGTELVFSEEDQGESQFTDGKYAYPNAHEGTELTLVPDEAKATSGGYLTAGVPASGTHYAVRPYDIGNTRFEDGTVHWLAADLRVNGGAVTLEIGSTTNIGSPRRMILQVAADGIYYKNNSGFVKAAEMTTAGKWANYMVKVEPTDNKATLYIDGVETCELGLYNWNNADGDNFYAVKMTTSPDYNATGTVDIDNLIVTTGAAPEIAQTGDASFIVAAAMMLPVSGIGLGALALKRKKEN